MKGNQIWIKHKGINRQFDIDVIFYRDDHNSLCIDFNGSKSQIDIILTPTMAKFVAKDLKKIKVRRALT